MSWPTRSELISALFEDDVAHGISADKNPSIIVTDGVADYTILSVYSVGNRQICIDIEKK